MKRAWILCLLAACAVTAPDSPGDDEPQLDDGKADGASSATPKGGLTWDAPRELAFATAEGDPTDLVYVTFSLSGDAKIAIDSGSSDTVYLYQPTGTRWGHSLARATGKLRESLGAGSYRVLVRSKATAGIPHVTLKASCTGDGCTPPPRDCSPTAPRLAAPGGFVGHEDWQASFEQLIDGAQVSLDVQMYQFSVQDIADHVIAAHKRGVAVRVILDRNQTVNAGPRAAMVAAGVPLQDAPGQFSYSHAKYLVIDGAVSVIATGNFNTGAVTKERNYAVTDVDPDDLADLESVFTADWSHDGALELSCTRLEVSPINSHDRILAHIASAKRTLDAELLYLDDAEIRNAFVAAAKSGVTVRVLLNDPAQAGGTTQPQLDDLNANGVTAGYNPSFFLHAKIIVADGVAHVGSENMSVTSLTKNREVGTLVFEGEPAQTIQDQFDSDWAGRH